jgi:osmoprotectant transport system permease protein
MFTQMMEYYHQNRAFFWSSLQEHLLLSVEAVCIAIVIGVPLGILCVRKQKTSKVIESIMNTLRVIPSLALMVLCIPIIGIGKTPAMIALIFLAVPPIVINTVSGFESVEPSLKEVACGMGMNAKQQFFRVEVPLAMPLILTGIRTAVTETIASTSIAAYIGAGGLGVIVFTGIGTNKDYIVLLGGLSIAVIAIVADAILATVQSALCRFAKND